MPITSLGIGSGLDANSIITQLVAIERRPISQLQTASNKLQTQISAYGQVQAGLDALKTKSEALAKASTFDGVLTTSSDASSVGVKAGTGAQAGSYAVEVLQLATAQSVASQSFASAQATLGAGTVRIELGALSGDDTKPSGKAFTASGGDDIIDLTVGADDTLAQLRDRINEAKKGVSASIVNDASGARLVLRSTQTGEDHAFRITATPTDPTAPGALADLNYEPEQDEVANPMTLAVAAGNAQAMFNGIEVTSSSNTLTNVVDGLTLTFSKVTTAPVTVTTAQDTGSMKKAVQEFASAYNDVRKLLANQTQYDDKNRVAGVLQGDSAARAVQAQLRNLLGGNAGTSTTFARLADIGFDLQSDGTIKTIDTKLDAALAKPTELKKLFAATDPANAGSDGFAVRLKKLAADLNDGILSSRKTGVETRIKSNSKRQEALGDRVDKVEARLRAQYTALDKKMGQLNALSSYVTQQVNAFNRKSDY